MSRVEHRNRFLISFIILHLLDTLRMESNNAEKENENVEGDVFTPISPTVLLVLQNKIKCQHCDGALKIKKHQRRRPWSLLCENSKCPSPRIELKPSNCFLKEIYDSCCFKSNNKGLINKREKILMECFED